MNNTVINNTVMNKFLLTIAAFVLTVTSDETRGQGPVNPESAPPVRGQIPFQRFKTDGTKIFLVRVVQKKDAPPVKIQRKRLVPEKTEDGYRYKEVIETVLTPALEEKLTPVSEQYVFRDREGKTISTKEMIGRLGMGNGKLVVTLMPGQSFPDAWRSLLAKDVILYSIDPKTPKK